MVYIMEFEVDGGCRGNGYSHAEGAAAACLMTRSSSYYTRTRRLDATPQWATSQRAEILAIIIALEWALEKYDELESEPKLAVSIKSDSRYAVNCMSKWVYKWCNNGWINAKGDEVANRDLIEEASDLDDRVKELGTVDYLYIPRAQNTEAHKACDELLSGEEDASTGYSSDGFW
ncbi:ribonuclease H-like domain-containing protein [Daldinia decipiens]|uniref:ribonuclease H-like domain-containing protein n=1 Tax=Daldinia decipiens TaxID=326647 RepID=UPI0020C42792|nr:ribonuclease H-like domain-containing protein [Daldinia decipiens]KAI1654461.1 ribonuclease H-like domain-containing protein [Daldinia decipiens]